jgi:predicted molibdopterin-dependent oxidoreductase YjgC
MAILKRLAEHNRSPVPFRVDGESYVALQGDTVLTAVLSVQGYLRHSDFSGEPRAGFCLMGACQDCWVRLGNGRRVRACSTLIEPDMQILRASGRMP